MLPFHGNFTSGPDSLDYNTHSDYHSIHPGPSQQFNMQPSPNHARMRPPSFFGVRAAPQHSTMHPYHEKLGTRPPIRSLLGVQVRPMLSARTLLNQFKTPRLSHNNLGIHQAPSLLQESSFSEYHETHDYYIPIVPDSHSGHPNAAQHPGVHEGDIDMLPPQNSSFNTPSLEPSAPFSTGTQVPSSSKQGLRRFCLLV